MSRQLNTRVEPLGAEWIIDGVLGDRVSVADGSLVIEWRLADTIARAALLTKAGGDITITDADTKAFRVRFSAAAQAAAGVTVGMYEDEIWYSRPGDSEGVFSQGIIIVNASLKQRYP